jgi:hypothetical protein
VFCSDSIPQLADALYLVASIADIDLWHKMHTLRMPFQEERGANHADQDRDGPLSSTFSDVLSEHYRTQAFAPTVRPSVDECNVSTEEMSKRRECA